MLTVKIRFLIQKSRPIFGEFFTNPGRPSASDGIVELCDPNGVQFGELGLIKSLQAVPVDQMVTKVHQALEAHAKGGVGHDDMSILILDCPARA